MNIIDNLIKYTAYSKGEISLECDLHYEDIEIDEVDFSPYDLNNSYFGGVTFKKCCFTKVYLSGSNFGGSIMEECVFNSNELKKSSWDDMKFIYTNFKNLDAFRTTFLYGQFKECVYEQCFFSRCLLSNSVFDNVKFVNCKFEDVNFSESIFKNVIMEKCEIKNVELDENSQILYL